MSALPPDRRLAFARALLLVSGTTFLVVGTLVAPLFFPYLLVAAAMAAVAAGLLRRAESPLLAVAVGSFSLIVSLLLLSGAGDERSGLGLIAGLVLLASGGGTLAIVYLDADRLVPPGPPPGGGDGRISG